jgi:hypothetical protein
MRQFAGMTFSLPHNSCRLGALQRIHTLCQVRTHAAQQSPHAGCTASTFSAVIAINNSIGIERDPDNGRRYRRAKVGGPVSVLYEPIYVQVISSVDVQAECNPARIAKLRFFLKWMKACGLHVAKTALKPDIPIEGRAACHFHGLLD